MNKSDDALLTIGEIAKAVNVQQHVIRFWETQFKILKPIKFNNRRYYRSKDLANLKYIHELLYIKNYSIKDATKMLKKKYKKSNPLERIHLRLTSARRKLDKIINKEIHN